MNEANLPFVRHYEMHPVIEQAYTAVHENKLDQNEQTRGYATVTWGEVKGALAPDAPQHSHRRAEFAAAYFHMLFPTHYFKVCHALQSPEIIGWDRLASWLRYNPYLIAIDIGCGDGAGSTALIDSLLRLRGEDAVDPRPIQLHCIGIDPSPIRLQLYEWMLAETAERVKAHNINVQINVIPKPFAESLSKVTYVLNRLVQQQWQQPSLHHVIAITSNILDLVKQQDQEDIKRLETAAKLESYSSPPLGEQLADFYRDVFRLAPIDHLHAITVDTEPEKIDSILYSTVDQLRHKFSSPKQIDDPLIKQDYIRFKNPHRSYWYRPWRETSPPIGPFIMSAAHIHSFELAEDSKWQTILKLENMELAWARARSEMLRESFCDEIELRLFEADLQVNLERLSSELEAYAIRGGYIPLSYSTPKDSGLGRPRGINRFEEEILMVAMIQVIGTNELGQNPWSYAYRLAPENSPERGATEYLYQRWSDSWLSFRTDIVEYAKTCPNGFVLKYDISSFFTEIHQESLRKITRDHIRISPRIEWLIEHLVNKHLDYHEPGKGLVQGGLGSGFLANVYLSSLDELFKVNDGKRRRLFRYVDDIVVVGSNIADAATTADTIEKSINILHLEKHPTKSHSYTAEEFINQLNTDELLDSLKVRLDALVKPLWSLDLSHRHRFSSALPHRSAWWAEIRGYRACLIELGIFVPVPALSRLVMRALQPRYASQDDTFGIDLQYPGIPNTSSVTATRQWARQFYKENPDWYVELQEVRRSLKDVFLEHLTVVTGPCLDTEGSDYLRAGRRVRFALNRLSLLGLDGICGELAEVLCSQPWHVRNHQLVLDAMGRQQYPGELWQILNHHLAQSEDSSKFIAAAAIRAVQQLPHLAEGDWNTLTDLMFADNEVIALMATQTWVFINAFQQQVPQADRVRNLITAKLENKAQYSAHLHKNYLLVLGLIDSSKLSSFSVQYADDPTLVTAFRIATQNSIWDLFSSVEPDNLRLKYYDTRYEVLDDGGSYSA